MSEDNNRRYSRRDLLAAAGRLSLGVVALPAMASTALGSRANHMSSASGRDNEEQTEATAEKVVDALEDAYGVHPGERRNHTKGVGARGVFVGNPEVAAYSRSALFSGETVEVIGRFSLAGADPQASDGERTPRGLALQFRLPGGNLHHMTMIHTPMFFAAVPQTFLDKFVALATDPATGKSDLARFKAFQASHPDNVGQARFLANNNPPPSYANCAYYGIHTFKLLGKQNTVTLVKYRFVPHDGEKQISERQLADAPRDFLEKALYERLANGPARWDMILTIGQAGDEQNNPTILWPENRRQVKAGTLTIDSAAASMAAGSYKINFDPMLMADGMAATDDPVLLFRSPSYAQSFTRRLRGL